MSYIINEEELRLELGSKKVMELKGIATELGVDMSNSTKKADLIEGIITKKKEASEDTLQLTGNLVETEQLSMELGANDSEFGYAKEEPTDGAPPSTEEVNPLDAGPEEALSENPVNDETTEATQKDEPDQKEQSGEPDPEESEKVEETPQQVQSDMKVVLIDIDKLYNSPLNYFKPLSEKKYKEVKESIEALGVLQPLIARPNGEGMYEILAGRNRKDICKELGHEKVPVSIKECDDLEAEEIIADTNVKQRDDLSPLEIAKSYEIKARAIGKRQGKRSDLTEAEAGAWRDLVGKEFEVSGMTVERYMRLNNLIPEIKTMLETEEVNVKTCFELGLLDKKTQEALMAVVESSDNKDEILSAKVAGKIKKALKEKNALTPEEKKELKSSGKEPETKPLTVMEIVDEIDKTKTKSETKDKVIKVTVPEAYHDIIDLLENDQKLVLDLILGYYEGRIDYREEDKEA